MDNLKNYLPVGESNAKSVSIVTVSSTVMMTGDAWLDTDTATEVFLKGNTPLDQRRWTIAGDQIVAIADVPPPAPPSA